MDSPGISKEKPKKNLIVKTLERCKSFGHRKGKQQAHNIPKSKLVVPEGYFVVHVGPDKERVVIRTKCVNHPLFKELLDEAEREYRYTCGGPIELPCDVDRFFRVLWEMEEEKEEVGVAVSSPRCGFAASPMHGFGKGHAGYRVLTPSRLVVPGRI